jgi:hypothetical protein
LIDAAGDKQRVVVGDIPIQPEIGTAVEPPVRWIRPWEACPIQTSPGGRESGTIPKYWPI